MTISGGRTVMVVALILGHVLGVMNATIITTALPAILDELNGTPVQGTWMLTATILFNTVSAPMWGRLADRFNPLVLLRIAHVLFIIGAVVGATANSMETAIGARVLQGLGIGGILVMAIVVLARIVPPRERGRYMAWMTAGQLAGTLTGPLIGGVIVESVLGWRWCFFVIVPVAAVILILLQFSVRLERQTESLPPIDYWGAFLIAVSLPAILSWISFVGDAFPLVSWMSVLLLGGGLLVFTVALIVEWRTLSPILPIRILGRRVILFSAIAVFAAGISGVVTALFMSLYFQIGRGVTPTVAGLLIVASAIGSVISAFWVGARTGKTGALRRYLIAGFSIMVLGSLLVVLCGPDAPLLVVAGALFVFGLGQGATTQFIILAAQNAVGLREIGSVSGFMNFTQLFGSAFGLSVFGAVLGSRLTALGESGMSEAEAYATAVPQLFVLAIVLNVVGVVAVSLLPRIRLRRTLDLEGDAVTG